jgi:phosphate transport system permease protein
MVKTGSSSKADVLFRWVTAFSALMVILVLAGILLELARHSRLAIDTFGWGFVVSRAWDPVHGEFGALSSIFGTLASTAIALIFAVPASLVIALFLAELAPPGLSKPVGYAIELLAAVPSIVYGMWGLFVLAPLMARHVQPLLGRTLGFLPLFKGPPMGIGVLTAGVVLAIMVLPYMTAVMRDVFQLVPAELKESGYGVGATTWEVTRKVTLGYGLRGLVGACFLGLGRAIGETMAVTFVIGNDHRIQSSLFAASNSIASTLANEFTEASEPLYLSSLVELGLVLFVLTGIIQAAAQLWLKHLQKKLGVAP